MAFHVTLCLLLHLRNGTFPSIAFVDSCLPHICALAVHYGSAAQQNDSLPLQSSPEEPGATAPKRVETAPSSLKRVAYSTPRGRLMDTKTWRVASIVTKRSQCARLTQFGQRAAGAEQSRVGAAIEASLG